MVNKPIQKKHIGLGMLLLIIAILASGQVLASDGAAANDTIAPTTTISVAENESFNNSVTIILDATDNTDGSGVNETLYTINGGDNVTYAGPFDVNITGQDNVTYWSVDNAGNQESPKMVNFTIENVTPVPPVPQVPFEFTVVPQSITVTPSEDAVYNLILNNTGNSSDTYMFAVDNGDANVVLSMNDSSVDNVSIEPQGSANVLMTVNSAVTGTFTVNVTATSEADINNSMTISTKTIVGTVPTAPGVNAMREIDSQFIGPGDSTNVTVNISSDMTQALVLQEAIPEGWNLTRISDDADSFRTNNLNEWLWINVTSGVNKTVVYKLTAPSNASIGDYSINGSIVNSTGMVTTVGGSNTVSISIIGYYKKLGDNPNKIDTSDVLKAIEDWRGAVTPDGLTRSITGEELAAMLDAWAMGE